MALIVISFIGCRACIIFPVIAAVVRLSCRMALNIVEDFNTKFRQIIQHLLIEWFKEGTLRIKHAETRAESKQRDKCQWRICNTLRVVEVIKTSRTMSCNPIGPLCNLFVQRKTNLVVCQVLSTKLCNYMSISIALLQTWITYTVSTSL